MPQNKSLFVAENLKRIIFQKSKSIFLISGILFCLLAASCALPESGGHAKANAPADASPEYPDVLNRAIASTTGVLPRFGYPYGLEFAYRV
jgi:hypothetical protein